MRFTEDQVRQALQHADQEVRGAALHYFADSFSRNPAIIADAIELIERFGSQEAFRYSYPIGNLAQTPASVAWAVQRLEQAAAGDDEYLHGSLGRLLCQAAPELVLPHRSAILSAPNLNRNHADRMELRLGLVATPSDQLWRRLEAICEEGKDHYSPSDIPYAEAEEIAETLARDPSQADRMMDWLGQEVDQENNTALAWLEIFATQIAGHMRYQPAVPLLIKKLMVDGEILNEEAVRALTKIGTDGAIAAVRDAYPQAPGHFRLYATGVLGNIHTDLAVSAGLELLAQESDFDQKVWLANALIGQYSTETIEAGRAVLLEDDPEFNDLKSSLVVACKLMDYQVPELEQWERELAAPRLRPFFVQSSRPPVVEVRHDSPSEFPISGKVKTGRNEPCPCGSGKKFKKCCLNKPVLPG